MSEYTHKTLRELASRPPGDLGAGVLLMQMRATLLACADTWEADIAAAERRAEAETWWPKPWPREFDGPVIVFAPSADPHRPLKTVAWWDGESLTHIPFVWVDAVTHIRPMPRGPEPDDAPASPPEEPR